MDIRETSVDEYGNTIYFVSAGGWVGKVGVNKREIFGFDDNPPPALVQNMLKEHFFGSSRNPFGHPEGDF